MLIFARILAFSLKTSDIIPIVSTAVEDIQEIRYKDSYLKSIPNAWEKGMQREILNTASSAVQ